MLISRKLDSFNSLCVLGIISDHFDFTARLIGCVLYDEVNKLTYFAEKFTEKSSNPDTELTMPNLFRHLLQKASWNLFDGFSLKLTDGGSRLSSKLKSFENVRFRPPVAVKTWKKNEIVEIFGTFHKWQFTYHSTHPGEQPTDRSLRLCFDRMHFCT